MFLEASIQRDSVATAVNQNICFEAHTHGSRAHTDRERHGDASVTVTVTVTVLCNSHGHGNGHGVQTNNFGSISEREMNTQTVFIELNLF
jgi:hypothetical protein